MKRRTYGGMTIGWLRDTTKGPCSISTTLGLLQGAVRDLLDRLQDLEAVGRAALEQELELVMLDEEYAQHDDAGLTGDACELKNALIRVLPELTSRAEVQRTLRVAGFVKKDAP